MATHDMCLVAMLDWVHNLVGVLVRTDDLLQLVIYRLVHHMHSLVWLVVRVTFAKRTARVVVRVRHVDGTRFGFEMHFDGRHSSVNVYMCGTAMTTITSVRDGVDAVLAYDCRRYSVSTVPSIAAITRNACNAQGKTQHQ